MLEEKLKHLEFIQSTINRMSANSFHIKGWMITIVSALLAIFATTKNADFVLVAIFPTAIFWLLDAYYLTQERKFRGLYNDVAGVTDIPEPVKSFEMSTKAYKKGEYSYWDVFRSKTILPLHLFLIIALVVLYLVLKFIN